MIGGVNAHNLDCFPKDAGFVYGLGNTAATLAGLISVPLTGVMLDRTGSWALVFAIAVGHYAAGAAAFAIWAGGSEVGPPEHGPVRTTCAPTCTDSAPPEPPTASPARGVGEGRPSSPSSSRDRMGAGTKARATP